MNGYFSVFLLQYPESFVAFFSSLSVRYLDSLKCNVNRYVGSMAWHTRATSDAESHDVGGAAPQRRYDSKLFEDE